MTLQLNYAALAECIEQQDWWFSPAELHGITTAFVATCHREQLESFLFPPEKITLSPIGKAIIDKLSAHIEQSLASEELHFHLPIPEDKSARTMAQTLIIWGEYFLLALRKIEPELDSSCLAFIEDLQQLILLDDCIDDNEDNFCQLNDLIEHCRLGALLIFTHCHTSKPAVQEKNPNPPL